jgi:hypothetical protein
VFKTPVFTSEIVPTYHIVSRMNLLWSRGVNISRSNSPDFLRSVCHEGTIGSSPMFYLDAHWHQYLPLPDELDVIGRRCRQGIIVIDDFFNPSDPRFRYDTYADRRIDVEVVSKSLRAFRDDIFVYVPGYSPDRDPTGKGIGFAVVLMGAGELPLSMFPFNLLVQVPS